MRMLKFSVTEEQQMNKRKSWILLIIGVALGLGVFALSKLCVPPYHAAGKASVENGRIEGRATTADHRPLAEVVIVITATTSREGIREIAPITNEAGEFSFPDLPPGEYTLQASRPGFQTQKRNVTVVADKTAKVEFVLPKN